MNRRMKRNSPILATLLLAVMAATLPLSACAGAGGSGTAGSSAAPDSVRIGLLIDSVVVERWQVDRDIFCAKAKELGAEVIVQNCNEDSARQQEQVRQMVADRVDALVVIPYDKDSLSEVVKNARRKGIPVIAYDRLIRDAGVDLYISFDNEKTGRLMGEGLLAQVPDGDYLIINGSPLDNNCDMLNAGFHQALDAGISDGRIRVVSEIWSDAWRPEDAYTAVSSLLAAGENIDAILAANDGLAGGAIRALAENRLAGKVAVAGQDADLSACQRLVEGTMCLTVYKPIKELAQRAAIEAVRLAKGEPVSADSTISDGTGDVPYIKFQPIPVTKDNLMDTIIKDGFHDFEDVYRNVPEDRRPETKAP